MDEDVRIRPYALADAPALFEAVRESLAALGPWLPWAHPAYAVSESEQWIAAQVEAFAAAREFNFVIESDAVRFLGGCGLNLLDLPNRRANLGYWVRSSAAGQGVAAAAVRLLARWAFDHTELDRLEIVVATGNAASARVAEKAGAVREGVAGRRLQLHGEAHDAFIFSLVRGDLLRR